MEFRTEIKMPPLKASIDHRSRGLMLGSCFVQNIAQRMLAAKFAVVQNPFGVLYNPLSIAHAINDLGEGRLFTRKDLLSDGGLWFSLSHHGSFSSPDPDAALDVMNARAAEGAQALAAAHYVVITLGTAWTYQWAESGDPVANCHKLPASRFTRRLCDIEEITDRLGMSIDRYMGGKNVILTVSPIRHIRDGLWENGRSKARLIEACHRLVERRETTEYFPAYEIMMDDLRDYRFYERDMVHPSPVAADYIWEKFRGATMDRATEKIAREMERLCAAVSHRPLHPDSSAYGEFSEKMLIRALELQSEYPLVDLSDEIKYFSEKR